MKRSGFLKTLAAIWAGLGFAPMIVKAEPEKKEVELTDWFGRVKKYPVAEKDALSWQSPHIIDSKRIQHLSGGRHRIHFNLDSIRVGAGDMVMDLSNERVYIVTLFNSVANGVNFDKAGLAFIEITPPNYPRNKFQRTCGNEFMVFQNARANG